MLEGTEGMFIESFMHINNIIAMVFKYKMKGLDSQQDGNASSFCRYNAVAFQEEE
jgi:hypothetical protein